MFLSKALIVTIHCIAWLMLFGLVAGFVSLSPGSPNLFAKLITPSFIVFCSVYVFLFYANTGFLIPQLFFTKATSYPWLK